MALKLRSWLKSKILTLFFYTGLVYTIPVIGQNLIPNASFEDTIQCPNNGGQIGFSNGWYEAGTSIWSSADFFNQCSLNFGVPNNTYGYQQARTGNSYAGIVTYGETFPTGPDSTREFIGTVLSSGLNIGTKYFVSLHANLALDLGETTLASNNLGFLFSTFAYNQSNPAPIANFAHYTNSTIITDTMNWVHVFGSFVADSAYTHLTIGNFFDSTNTNHVEMFGPNVIVNQAFYYIDDVCVSTDSLTCYNFVGIEELADQNQIKLYPNPANEVVYVESDEPIERIELYNLTGQLLLSEERSYGLNIGALATGVYIVKVYSNDTVLSERLIKN